MSPSSVLRAAASHRTGGERSFPTSFDAVIQRNFPYNAPDVSYAKLWFRQVHAPDELQPVSTARPCAGWVIPRGSDNCHPVLVAHSLVAAIWLIREMLPVATLANDNW
jgi:hypothetical protein